MDTGKFNDGFMARGFRHCVAAVLLIFAGQSVLANELSYSFVEIAYADGDLNDESSDGFTLSGSVDLGEMFFVAGSYQDFGMDDLPVDLELIRVGFTCCYTG
jgi:hypothetical protein